VIGDSASDVHAARAAGATAIMVPTAVTLPDELLEAPFVVDHLRAATELALLSPTQRP
jgi:phosphoglycolate phosphatase-like HAD superfamily hydrolase